jgi:hypothetical protein
MLYRKRLEAIEHLLERLDAAVVVRDPGNARAAEQYEGLRKQIGLAAKNHRVHVAHLLSLADSLEKGATLALLNDRINDFLAELGVERIQHVTDENLFEIVETVEGESDSYEVLVHAVVERLESGTTSPIRLGRARKIVAPATTVAETAVLNVSNEETPFDSPTKTKSSTAPWLRIAIAICLIIFGVIIGTFISDNGNSTRTPSNSSVLQNEASSTTSTVAATTSTPSISTSTTVSGSTTSIGE